MLQSLHFDNSSIDAITKDLSKLEIQIKGISHSIDDKKIGIKVEGIDEFGNAVTAIRNYDIASKEVFSKNVIKQSFDSATTSAQKYNKAIFDFNTDKFSTEIINAQSKLEGFEKSGVSNLSGLKVHINDASKALEGMNQNKAPENRDAFMGFYDDYVKSITKAKNAVRQLNAEHNSLSAILDRAKKSVLSYVGSYFTIQQAIRIFKDMYQNVVAVDTAMTNLYKVTDETSASYDRFLKNASKNAKDLGNTISGYINQSADWAKLGYSLSEAEELSKLSSIYVNVGEVDEGTAVKDMVTALKGFSIETSNAVKIIDTYNKLGNEFAVTSAGIGDGVRKSASAMHTANVSFEQTAAMLAGISEITQDTSAAGDFLKIASMRIRGMKGELQALGEEVDDSVNSISKVQTQILNLTHGSVNIFDENDEFRNYYEIMKDISEVFDDLSSTEKASLTEILFGKLRGNQGAALIQAFKSGQIEKAYEAAMNSSGSAMAEQERWLESLEAKTQQLKAAIEGLSIAVLDSDFLKNGVDTLTKIVSATDSLIDNFGMMPILIGAIGTAILNSKGLDYSQEYITQAGLQGSDKSYCYG